MRSLVLIFIFSITGAVFSQSGNASTELSHRYERDTVIVMEGDSSGGYHHSYVLYIPAGTLKFKEVHLLVEPNNTAFTTDSIEVHLNSAIELASKSSVGNNVSRMLKIPLLVPVFPRPASQPLLYTHALDRDVMMEKNSSLERLDLQLISMVNDAKKKLNSVNVIIAEKFLMSGFSASGTFVNRFAFFHPEKIEALATGGLNSILMFPLKELNGEELNYPLGINDVKQITGKPFSYQAYKEIPQFIYMGEMDDNDAVKFDDAYSKEEREIIFSVIGEDMQSRWQTSREIYKDLGINARFRTYKDVGHWTTSDMLWEIIKFFQSELPE